MSNTISRAFHLVLVLLVFGSLILIFAFGQTGCGSGGGTPTPGPTEVPGDDLTEGTATPGPEETIAPITGDFTLDRESIAFDHSVGETGCPQLVGEIIVTSTFSEAVLFTVGVSGPLSVSPDSFSLDPGTTQVVQVFFTCEQATSFVGAVAVEANGITESIPVTGTVTVPAPSGT